jgi:hypothetical protein
MMQQPEMTDRRRLTSEYDGRLIMTMTPIEVCTGLAKQQNDLVHRQGMAAQSRAYICRREQRVCSQSAPLISTNEVDEVE